jgi:hypothetical protein
MSFGFVLRLQRPPLVAVKKIGVFIFQSHGNRYGKVLRCNWTERNVRDSQMVDWES